MDNQNYNQQLTPEQQQMLMMQQQMMVQQQMMQNQQMMNNQQQDKTQKKGFNMMFVAVPIILIVILMFGVKFMNSKKVSKEPEVDESVATGLYAYNNLKSAIKGYDDFENSDDGAKNIDSVVGSSDGDSYIAQEIAYINNIMIREDFIKKVFDIFDMSVPEGSVYLQNMLSNCI